MVILFSCIILLFFSGCFQTTFLYAKKKKATPANAFSHPELKKVLQWRSIGPHRGGRVIAVAGHPTKKQTFYMGVTGGGVWKTQNGGNTWEDISHGFFKTSSVGAIALSESEPHIIYVGMGECCLRGNISHGDGVYKSTNNGKTWQNVGLRETRHISRIRVHPKNSSIVYVAALGHAFGPNQERGVYKSIDGGKTWKQILFRNENTGAIDLIINPEDPNILFAAFWQVRRYPWGFESGGPGSGIFKSSDGGKNWQDISNNPGLPEGIKGRIGLTSSAAKPDRVWAIIEAKKKGLYLSDDGGNTWKMVSNKADLLQRPWYYHHIKADPCDADTLYVMNVRFWKTTDMGKTFKMIRTPHGDNHDLWIDPKDPNRMIEANDGGATVSFDGGKTWSSIYNQATAQFYHVTVDNQFPYRVYGAQQDNSTISVPSRSADGAITQDQWYGVGGCESGYIAVDPRNPNIVYAGCYDGMLTRYDHQLKMSRDISVWPENPMGAGAEDLKYRFQWTFPILFSPHDPNILLTSGNHVFKSTNEGQSWKQSSPDLTRNDKTKMHSSGGPITKDNTSVEYYGTIFALAESPLKQGLFWAGSDDGLVHVSTNNCTSWKNVTPKDLPEWALISIIEPSHFDAATAYIAATRYKLDDHQPYLYKTTDYGKTWQKITSGIPRNDFTRVIREHPQKKGYLFAGTETGIYFSDDDGSSWLSLQLNLPVTPIHDLVLYNDDLIVATHGRSFWILDDLSKLWQLLSLKTTSSDFLFKPRNTIRYRGWYREKVVNAGKSLPVGVIVNYYLKSKPKKGEKISLTFLNHQDKKIRTFTNLKKDKNDPVIPAKVGINQFVWDMHYPPEVKVPGAIFWAAWGNISPIAVPGKYAVILKVGEKNFRKEFEILKDPRLKTTQQDYQKQFDLLIKIRNKLTETHEWINELRNIRKQMETFMKKIEGRDYHKKLAEISESIKKKMAKIEDELIQHKAKAVQDLLNYPIKLNNKLAALAGVVSRVDAAPTEQAYSVYEDLQRRVDKQLILLKEIINQDVKLFNETVWNLKVPALLLKKKGD
jgi:photosystem II stability/assembly factor-like uncharacterized protein